MEADLIAPGKGWSHAPFISSNRGTVPVHKIAPPFLPQAQQGEGWPWNSTEDAISAAVDIQSLVHGTVNDCKPHRDAVQCGFLSATDNGISFADPKNT